MEGEMTVMNLDKLEVWVRAKEGESLLYTLIYYGQFGITKNFESRFQYLDSWQNLK
jgi:hypothetical protein